MGDEAENDVGGKLFIFPVVHDYPYSVMDYVKRALRAIDEDSTLWKLVTALYRYHQAADTYFADKENIMTN